ncbi:hypothetical protein, partial [Lentzea sp. CC55]|uniref:hypothetical protein n=1 Tax=Lentzea sp. CC55 TaxID=2884909 RepID=UPI001F39163B
TAAEALDDPRPTSVGRRPHLCNNSLDFARKRLVAKADDLRTSRRRALACTSQRSAIGLCNESFDFVRKRFLHPVVLREARRWPVHA